MKKTLALLMIMTACGVVDERPDGGGGADAGPAECTCVALGADYMAGVGTLATIQLPSLTVTTGLVPAGISGDPVLRAPGDGRIYVVNRFGADNIMVLDATDHSLIDQFSTGAGSNPQDIAVRGSKGYVAGLDLADVLVYDLTDTAAAPATIDISSYDPDGFPNPASIAIVGDRAYVALGLLDSSFLPQGPGKVVVIDLANDTVETSFDLLFPNPTGFLRAAGNTLLVATVDDFSGVTGCLETITTEGAPSSVCSVMNSQVMGTVNAIAPSDQGTFFVVTSYDPSFNPLGRIVHFTPTGLTDQTPAAHIVTDMAWCAATRQLVYTDQATGGIRVKGVNPPSDEAGPFDLGLPAAYSNGISCY